MAASGRSVTYRLAGAEYGMTYKSPLPEGVGSSPPSVFIWQETEDIDGLVVPKRYEVIWKKEVSRAVKGEVDDLVLFAVVRTRRGPKSPRTGRSIRAALDSSAMLRWSG